MPDYRPQYPIGTWVRIASRADLEAFTRSWFSRDAFKAEQLAHADRVVRVTRVPCYYAGDALYECSGVPGMWHEHCLRASEGSAA